MYTKLEKYPCQSQIDWIDDDSPLKIAVKPRQTGFSYANSFRLVVLISAKGARLDAFISSRDEFQAKLQVQDCLYWARLLHFGASELGEMLFDKNTGSSVLLLVLVLVIDPPCAIFPSPIFHPSHLPLFHVQFCHLLHSGFGLRISDFFRPSSFLRRSPPHAICHLPSSTLPIFHPSHLPLFPSSIDLPDSFCSSNGIVGKV